MKAKTHPQYFETTVTCACGNTFTTGSTKEKIEVEICSNCHPFYTGKQKLIDTAGVVDRFKAKLEKKKTISAARADAAKKKAEKAAAKTASAAKEPASVKEKLAAARRTRGKVATTTSKKAGKASAAK